MADDEWDLFDFDSLNDPRLEGWKLEGGFKVKKGYGFEIVRVHDATEGMFFDRRERRYVTVKGGKLNDPDAKQQTETLPFSRKSNDRLEEIEQLFEFVRTALGETDAEKWFEAFNRQNIAAVVGMINDSQRQWQEHFEQSGLSKEDYEKKFAVKPRDISPEGLKLEEMSKLSPGYLRSLEMVRNALYPKETPVALNQEQWHGLLGFLLDVKQFPTALQKIKDSELREWFSTGCWAMVDRAYRFGRLIREVEIIRDYEAEIAEKKREKVFREYGGAQTANKAKARADQWRLPALNFAQQERQKNPKLGQRPLARRIFDQGFPGAPSDPDTIINTIRRWEKDGSLARSIRNVGGDES